MPPQDRPDPSLRSADAPRVEDSATSGTAPRGDQRTSIRSGAHRKRAVPRKAAPPRRGARKAGTPSRQQRAKRRAGSTKPPTKGRSSRRSAARTRRLDTLSDPALYGKLRTLTVGAHRIAPGQSRHVNLKVSETMLGRALHMPVTVVNGGQPGPTVFLAAAIHGDELNGVQVIRTLITRLSAAPLRGAVLAVPIVNVEGLLHGERYLRDRRDLNRNFPGDPQGNLAERLAASVMDLVRQCDVAIDLHTASIGRCNMSHVRGDLRQPDARLLAKAFGAEVTIDRPGHGSSLRGAASDAGIPTLTFEGGEAHRFEPQVVSTAVLGISNVLTALRMVDGVVIEPPFRIIVRQSLWVRAPKGGILLMHVSPREVVHQGQVIAVLSTPFGTEEEAIRAPFTGLVLGITTSPLAHPGTPICHMIKLEKTLAKVSRVLGSAPPPAGPMVSDR